MAGKRSATSELNHINWSREEDPEDAGNFSKAPDEILKNRIIKVAKRRNPIGTPTASEENKSAFLGFGGFSKTAAITTSTQSPFGFLGNLKKPEDLPKTNGLTNDPVTLSSTVFQIPENKTTPLSLTKGNSGNSNESKEYYAKLKGLNQSVSNWIKKHVDSNPFLNLTPIFRDYEKYLEDIENAQGNTKGIEKTTFKPSETQKASCNVDKNTEEKKVPNFGSSGTFSFGKGNVPAASTNITGFSFGGESAKPFTFANVSKPTDSEGDKEEKEGEEDDDEPPKVEFTPVMEDGHVYTIHCKVFFKKDGKFVDRGVGNLYLKPVLNKNKMQVIVRADTSLGRLLCNFILSASIPIKRLGKKDVMLVCIPTDDSKPPPIPILFRVKSTEDADELFKTLEKQKK